MRLRTRVQAREVGRKISAVMQQQLLVASEIHLILQTFPRQSSSLSQPHSYFCTLSLDNSFQMGCQRGWHRLHPRCFFRLSPHTHIHKLFFSSSTPSSTNKPDLFAFLDLLLIAPPLSPPPNKCLIFPMMISLINLDKAIGCSVSVEHETLAGPGGDMR